MGLAGAEGVRTNHVCTTGDQAGAKHDCSESLQQCCEVGTLALSPPLCTGVSRAHSLVRETKAEQGHTMQTAQGL